MTFLNASLLLGLAAFAIPLIIHLLNKRKYRDVRWGAVHLLHDVVKKNHRRMRIEQLLLLLMRISIPIFLALLMAKPVLTRSIKWLQDERVSTVFLIDDSFSMQATDAAGRTRFAEGRQAIAEIVEQLHEGSDANVILMGGRPHVVSEYPTTDLSQLTSALEAVEPTANPASLAQSLQAGLAELAVMNHPAREVILVSDFQSSDWTNTTALANLKDELESVDSTVRPSLTFLSVGRDHAANENIAIQSVSASSSIVAVDQKVTLRALVQNHGTQSLPDIEVALTINDEPVRTTRVSIAAGQVSQALFTHSFDTPGTHVVKVSTDGDKIQADNRFIAIISVREELPVALVDGNPGLRPLDGDTSFLQLALRPHAESKSQLKDLVTTSSVEYRRLNDRLLQDSKVCVLANVPQISSGMLQRLKEFVKLGGGLLIFAGDAIEVDWYNQQLFDNGDGLLPMPIDSLQGRSIPGSARPSATVANQFFEHPALAFFNEPQNGGTSRAKFHRWLHLKLTDEYSAAARASVESNSHVLARLSTGAPWMVEKPFGRGRVIMVATTADSDWGNLPALPAYVPLIQRLTVYLASSVTPPNNLNPGEPLVSLHPQHHIHRNARLVDAKGTEHQIKIAGEGRRGRIEFSKTLEPGVYRVTDPDGQIENFAVNLSRQESEPELLAMDKLEELGQSVNAVVINGASDYAKLDRQRRFGTGMWKPILWILLAFLFLEILFQQWITNRRLT